MTIHRFFLMSLLLSVFLFAACEKALKFENTALVEHPFQDFKVYHLKFAFTNPTDQLITIKAVDVLDKDGKKIDHDPQFYTFLKQTNFRIELLTHDTSLEGYKDNPWDLTTSPFVFAEGTPLQKAVLISHKEYTKGKTVFGDKTNQDMKVTIKNVDRVMKAKETINPARHLLFTKTPHEKLQLKVSYEGDKGLQHVTAEFEIQKK
ncbi:MAG: hypothetical protein HQM13_19155 [SAR324 cluster bacterium]|nr:hypothetical protein [SAR324 cluster bacterium]